MSTDPMRVCFVLDEFPVLSQTFVINQIRGLRERGAEVSVVGDRLNAPLPGDEGIATELRWRDPSRVEARLAKAPRRLRNAVRLWADLGSEVDFDRYDVLIAHFGGNGRRLARVKALGRLRRPFVTVFHGHDVALPAHDGRLSAYRGLFARGDLFLPVSEYFKRLLVEAGAPPDRTRVHRMGVDCAAIPFAPPSRDGGPVRFLTVGRLVEKKGATYAIAAFDLLRRRRPDLDWRFDLVGDGPLLQELEAQAATAGLGDLIAFLGPQPHVEVARRLAAAHAFVLPSVKAANGDLEGVPVALMEAMAAGVVVVSTRHSGIPELIEDGVGGLLADERDAEGLSRRLEEVIDNAPRCAAFARAGRTKVEAEFSQRKLDDAMFGLVAGVARR